MSRSFMLTSQEESEEHMEAEIRDECHTEALCWSRMELRLGVNGEDDDQIIRVRLV